MRKNLTFFTLITVAALLGGCIVTKTPLTNDVTIPLGAQVTFSVLVFPSTATYAWTLDWEPLPNTGRSYVYTAQDGEHFLTVKATHNLGTDTQTWHILTNTFNKIYGGIYGDYAHAVQQTSDGGYILAGWTNLIWAVYYDAWLIKTDANGNKVWDKTFGGSYEDVASAVQQTSDGGYILAGVTRSFGAGNGDAWLIKTGAYGNKVWDKTFGGSYEDGASAVQQTSDGGYILAGYNGSFGAGSSDAWLIKTDAHGNKVWDKTFGGSYEDEAYAVQQTSDGGYLLVGYTDSFGAGKEDAWLIKTDASGETCDCSGDGNCYENESKWVKTLGGSGGDYAYSVQQTSDGGYILAGFTNSYGAGYDDVWLIKTAANGNEVWDKTFGGISGDWASAVQQTSDGGYILAGRTSSSAGLDDAWLIKTDAHGNKVWDKTFGGGGLDYAKAVQQTSDGGYILAGYTISPPFGADDYDAWLIKTDAYGNTVWDTTFGGGSAYAMQQTSDGGYILAGAHGGAWLVKTDADGNKVWDTTFGGGGASAMQQTSDGGYILAGWTGSYPNIDAWRIKTDANGNKVCDTTD